MNKIKYKIVDDAMDGDSIIKSLPFDCSVKSLSEISEKNASMIINTLDGVKWFKEDVSGFAFLKYPLGVIVKVEINSVKSSGSLLWILAQVYKDIYSNKENIEKYGVYGHEIDDLVFEQISICKNKVIIVSVGS